MQDFVLTLLGIIFIVLIYFVLPFFIIKHFKLKPNELNIDKSKFPFRKKVFLSNYEKKLYNILSTIINQESNNHYLFIKTRLVDIIEISIKGKDYLKYFNKIKYKHIDFLITDLNFQPVYAIELNDKTHQNIKTFERDNFVNMCLYSAGIDFLIIANSQLDINYIKNLIKL